MPLLRSSSSHLARSAARLTAVVAKMTIRTASVINIGPVVSGKHIGVSLLIEADSQHLYEKTVDPCSVCRFNSYEHRCISCHYA